MSLTTGAVLVVGSRCMVNRTPVYLAELARRAGGIMVLQKSFLADSPAVTPRLWSLVCKAIGSIIYHCLLPILVFRATLVFLPASNNYDALPVRFWTRIFRRPLMVDYYVSVYEWESLLMKVCAAGSFRERILRWSDIAAYQADFLIHFNRAEMRHVAELLQIKDRSSSVFQCPLFTRFDKAVEKIAFPAVSAPVSFVWWGSLLPLHGLSLIVQAFDQVAKIREDFRLHLCFMSEQQKNKFFPGDVFPGKNWLVLHADLLLRDGSLPRFVNQHAHIGFSHFGVGAQSEYVGSNKVAEAMSLGRTCLISDAIGNAEIYGYPDAFFVCKRSADSMATAILQILDSPQELQVKGIMCRRIFEQHYSEDAGTRAFERVLEEVDSHLRRK